MHWIVDNANLFYFLLTAALLILLAMAWSSRETRHWTFAGIAAGMIVLLWLLTRVIVTDRQAIGLNLETMATSVVNKNPDAVLKHVSKDFKYGRLSREDLFKLVDASVRSHNVGYVKLWDKQIIVNGDTADVRFNFRADAKGGQQYPASAQAKFVRENGQWKLREVQVFKLGTTERQYIPGVD
jgi:hypothetical protein